MPAPVAARSPQRGDRVSRATRGDGPTRDERGARHRRRASPDLRVAPDSGEARRCRPWERCPTGRGQRRDLGLMRKPFLFFNKLYKASADFFATSCKEVEILTAWLKGQVARAR